MARETDQQSWNEAFVAAILTAATVDSSGTNPKTVMLRYCQVLSELRQCGGAINPSPPRP